MRILVTGYSRQHTSADYTGTFGSLLAAALRLAGHYVVQDAPMAVMEDDFDYFLVGVDSPLAVTSRTALSSMAMIAELAPTGKLSLFVDDPNMRKVGSSHNSALDTPERLLTPYLERNRTKEDVAIFGDTKKRSLILLGADIVANPNHYGITGLIPQHAWAPRPNHTVFPGGVETWNSIDPSGILLRPDAVLDMGMEAHDLGAIARNRAEIWVAVEQTSSRAKTPWIAQTTANIVQPSLPAINTRHSLIEGFCQALLSMGVLEQPPSPAVVGWWSPWLALSVAAGAYYSTEHLHAAGPAFAVLPSQFENMTDSGRAAVIAEQRDTVRALIAEWSPERVADLILAKESVNG